MFYLIDNRKMNGMFFDPIGAETYCENKYTVGAPTYKTKRLVTAIPKAITKR